MAVIGVNTVQVVSDSGGPARVIILMVKGATNADTLDVGTWVRRIDKVTFTPISGNAAASIPTFAGTVITLGPAALSLDAGYLVVVGPTA